MRSAVSCGQLTTEMRANAVDLLKQLEDQVRIRQFALVHPGPPWSALVIPPPGEANGCTCLQVEKLNQMIEENLEQGMFAGLKAFVVRTAMGPYKFQSSSCKKKTCGCIMLHYFEFHLRMQFHWTYAFY